MNYVHKICPDKVKKHIYIFFGKHAQFVFIWRKNIGTAMLIIGQILPQKEKKVMGVLHKYSTLCIQ